MSDYFAAQLTGPVVSAVKTAAEERFTRTSVELEYMRTLSLETLSDDVLRIIGLLIGYPWPVAPTGTFGYNYFTLGAEATFPVTDTLRGLSGVGLVTGGLLSTIGGSYGDIYPSGIYRVVLQYAAEVRYRGLCFDLVDRLTHAFQATGYTLDYQSDGSLLVDLGTLGTTSTQYILEQFFIRYALSPAVYVVSA